MVNTDYCDYLRKFDYRVPYNKKSKDFRPFVGVLFTVNDVEYFAPLSSPKEKHLRMKKAVDFIKIDNGSLGIINFNNMIPVTDKNYQYLNYQIYDESIFHDRKYYEMQKKELMWLNRHWEEVTNKAYKLYYKYVTNKLPNFIKARCCDFKLLEEKCVEYNMIVNI